MDVYTIKLKKFYLILLGLFPLWLAITMFVQIMLGGKVIPVIIGLLLLTVIFMAAQNIARKLTNIRVLEDSVSFENSLIPINKIEHIKINKSGIGTSAIEFHLKSDSIIIFTLPDFKGNANKAIAFMEKKLPQVKFIAPLDMLED